MRLIDADTVAEAINDEIEIAEKMGTHKAKFCKSGLMMALAYVNTAPTIDAVPVVRCKDCKHYAFTDNRVPQERVWWCYYWGYEIGADDYCSNGERKDNDKQ